MTEELAIACDDEDIQSTSIVDYGAGRWPIFLSQVERGTGIKHLVLLDRKAALGLRNLLSGFLSDHS
jgi:hypothetical protein